MSEILMIVPSEYTKVDPDALYEQTGVDSSRLSQAANDQMLIDINDMLRTGGYITDEQTVMEVLETPSGEYFLRIE